MIFFFVIPNLVMAKGERGDESGEDDPEAESQMRAAVRSQGRLSRRAGR